MLEINEEAKEVAEALWREVSGIENWVDPTSGCVYQELHERYSRANSLLCKLINDYPCDVSEVKRLLYSSLEKWRNPGGVMGLQNAAFYTMHGLAKYSMLDPNVQKLIKRIYCEAHGSDIGKEAKHYLLEAEIELPELNEEAIQINHQKTKETWAGKIKDHFATVMSTILASILTIVSFYNGN